MLVIAKGLSFLGVVLLLGAGLMANFLLKNATDPTTLQRFHLGKKLGIGLIILGGLIEILGLYLFLPNEIPAVQKWSYIHSSKLDLFFLIRCFWVGLLAWTMFRKTLARGWQNAAFIVATLGMVLSFSLSSSTPSQATVMVSFIHIVCGALWAGAVVYTAILPLWSKPEKRQDLYVLMKRISIIGISSVILMSLTGVYSATTHMATAETLVSTPYGRVLIFKAILVLNTLVLAFSNLVLVLPILKSKGSSPKLAQFVQIEAVLLILILFATGLLTNSPLLPINHEHLTGL